MSKAVEGAVSLGPNTVVWRSMMQPSQTAVSSLPLDPVLKVSSLPGAIDPTGRSEEHTSELQSLMRISYAVFCLKKKNTKKKHKKDTCREHHKRNTRNKTYINK